MKLNYLVTLIAICVSLEATSGRGLPPQEVEECPDGCQCHQFKCELDEGEIYCDDLQVMCRDANVTSQLELLPQDATRIFITGENMGHTSLDIFATYDNLVKLSLDNNTIRSLKLSKPIGLIDYLSMDNNNLCFLPLKKLTLLRSLRTLTLQGNNLTFIHSIQFPTGLRHLDMSHNRLESPRKGSFRRLRRLEVLKLDHNLITAIIPRAFRHMQKLQSLMLDHNQIVHLPQNAFTPFPSISFLGLSHNLIKSIHPSAFHRIGLRWYGQHQIYLEHNEIKILQKEWFSVLYERRDYYSVYLAGNPLFCDCEMMLIRDSWGKLFRDFDRTLCDTPSEMQNLSVADLNIVGCRAYDDDY